jgi:hypothetical protein
MTTVTVENHSLAADGSSTSGPVSQSVSTVTWWKPLLAIAAVLIVGVIMWLAYAYWIKPTTIMIKTGYVPFAGLAVVTAALERLLEPLSEVLLPKDSPRPNAPKQKAARSMTEAQAAARDLGKSAEAVAPLVKAAAKAQAVVDARPTVRTMAFWAIASSCGLVIAGSFGFFLLQAVASNHVNTALDLGVTGLAIGAGTKPLHDLITGIQSKKAA